MAEAVVVVPEEAQVERVGLAPHLAALVYLAGLGSSASRLTMAGCLDRIARAFQPGSDAKSYPWHTLRYAETQAIRSWLAENFAPATATKYLAALRGVLKEAWRLGLMSAEDRERACDLDPIRGHREPPGRMLTEGELSALFAACKADLSPAGPRDAALFALLFGAGLRRSEATTLELRHYNPETGEIHVEHGKGNKDRVVWVSGGGKRAVDAWLEVRGLEDGPFLYPVAKGGKITQRHMTGHAIYMAAKKRAKEAGIPEFQLHDGRRTFLSNLWEHGRGSEAQRLAGHASLDTTAKYDRRGHEAARKAVELIHIPY